MSDSLNPAERSRVMSKVKSKDTTPEMLVRRLVHRMGYRYKLHDRRLPGKPDLVFPSRKKLIFVHGCFWHRHESCSLARLPKSRKDFWLAKLEGNRQRDTRHCRELRASGWEILVIWECETKLDHDLLAKRLDLFLKE
ncbi:very short patch repair endonuclease [Oleiagrimonas soli]|uniref:very short patch repair endonuclease n=1 Tax=Oleiagrimonas soli TaxID=1543381 RepID=UPI0006934B78|nr:very short patch repair endonuclease [Oleiagrimonas soli]